MHHAGILTWSASRYTMAGGWFETFGCFLWSWTNDRNVPNHPTNYYVPMLKYYVDSLYYVDFKIPSDKYWQIHEITNQTTITRSWIALNLSLRRISPTIWCIRIYQTRKLISLDISSISIVCIVWINIPYN